MHNTRGFICWEETLNTQFLQGNVQRSAERSKRRK